MSTQQDKPGQSSNPKPSIWSWGNDSVPRKGAMKPLNKPLTFSGDAKIPKIKCQALMPMGIDPKTGRTIYSC